MRKKEQRKIVELHDPTDTDPSWAMSNPSGLKVTPQSFVGTSKTIATSHPTFIEIKYKAKYQINASQLSADRKYFYVLENSYTRNIPTACFCFPDNPICPGDDCIEQYYFDRGIYATDGYCWCTGCVGGTPTVFYDEIQYQCCCIVCYENVNQCLGCNSKFWCGERIRISPYDRCCCCISNKYCWACNMCGLFGPVNGQPIIMCPIESGLANKESEKLKNAMDKAREEWQDAIDHLVDKEIKEKSATQALMHLHNMEAEKKRAEEHPDSKFAKARLAEKNKPKMRFGAFKIFNSYDKHADPHKMSPTKKQSELPEQVHHPNLEHPMTSIDHKAGATVPGFAGHEEHYENSSKMYEMWEQEEKIVLSHQAIDKEKGQYQKEEKKIDYLPPDWIPPHEPDPITGIPRKPFDPREAKMG